MALLDKLTLVFRIKAIGKRKKRLLYGWWIGRFLREVKGGHVLKGFWWFGEGN